MKQSVALVTGAARGIGRAIALRLSQEGSAVAVHYRSSTELAESLAARIRSENRRALAVRGDVSNPGQVQSIIAQVTRDLGPIDILVNNAVAFHPGGLADLKD